MSVVGLDAVPALAPALDAAAYRIVQESLANALAHAGAVRTSVAVVEAEGVLRITVSNEAGTPAAAHSEQGSGWRACASGGAARRPPRSFAAARRDVLGRGHDAGFELVTRIRVFLVDDEAMVRQGLRMIIESEEDLEVVGEAGDGGEAVHNVPGVRPDVVLMDVRMPKVDGVTATRRLLGDMRTAGRTRVVMLTTFDLDEYVFEALRAGASGFLLKNALRRRTGGGNPHRGSGRCAPGTGRDQARRRGIRLPATGCRRRASGRDLERAGTGSIRLVALGYTNGEIADRLVVGEATVKTHVGSILAKLGARDRVAAVIAAFNSGLVGVGESDTNSDT